MSQVPDMDFYGNSVTASSQFTIEERFTPHARSIDVCGVTGQQPTSINIDNGEVVLSIPFKTRFLNEEEEKVMWTAIRNSVKLVARGRLVK